MNATTKPWPQRRTNEPIALFQNDDRPNPARHVVRIRPLGRSALRLSPGPRPPLPTQNTQTARFALDQAAWMLCFVSPALAGSSFTYAEHPDNPIPVIWYSSSSSKNQVDTSEQQGGDTCQSEVKKGVIGVRHQFRYGAKRRTLPSAEGWANLGSDPKNSRTAACATARLRSHPLRCLRPTHGRIKISGCFDIGFPGKP